MLAKSVPKTRFQKISAVSLFSSIDHLVYAEKNELFELSTLEVIAR